MSRRHRPRVVLPALLLALSASLVVAGPAHAAKWKPKTPARTAQVKGGAAGDSTATELPTGALGSHSVSAAAAGKDCFVVKKRALVPGTGYMIRKSTFCN